MGQVQGSSGKSLLVQTVALFEALLTRIKTLQADNNKLKALKVTEDEENNAVVNTNDELVFTVESLDAKNKLLTNEKEEALNHINQLKHENELLERQLEMNKTDLEKKDDTLRKYSTMQTKIEEDLRKEISSLSQKLRSTMSGHQAESEMYEQSLLKVNCLGNEFSHQPVKIHSNVFDP